MFTIAIARGQELLDLMSVKNVDELKEALSSSHNYNLFRDRKIWDTNDYQIGGIHELQAMSSKDIDKCVLMGKLSIYPSKARELGIIAGYEPLLNIDLTMKMNFRVTCLGAIRRTDIDYEYWNDPDGHKRLESLRILHGLTADQFANVLGFSPYHIRRTTSGSRKILERMATAVPARFGRNAPRTTVSNQLVAEMRSIMRDYTPEDRMDALVRLTNELIDEQNNGGSPDEQATSKESSAA